MTENTIKYGSNENAGAYKEIRFSDTGLDENDLRNIKCPVLISHGEEETFVKLEDVIYTWQLIENADIYLAPNGDHFHHIDQIDVFGPIVLRFLKKVYGHQER